MFLGMANPGHRPVRGGAQRNESNRHDEQPATDPTNTPHGKKIQVKLPVKQSTPDSDGAFAEIGLLRI